MYTLTLFKRICYTPTILTGSFKNAIMGKRITHYEPQYFMIPSYATHILKTLYTVISL